MDSVSVIAVMEAKELREYIRDVVEHNDLEHELQCVRRILIGVHRYTLFTPEERTRRVKKFDMMFKALLTEKARQERSQKVGNHNSSSAENCGTRPADDATGGVSIRDVLEKEIAGGGQ